MCSAKQGLTKEPLLMIGDISCKGQQELIGEDEW